MLQVLTDEESVAHADEQVERVAKAMAYTLIAHPGTTIEACAMVLWSVNGQSWICASDMARAKVRAKALVAERP